MNEGERYTGEFKIKNEVGKNLLETYEAKRVSEEIKTILEEMRFKASIYRDHKKRELSFNDEEKNCALLLDYIQQKENIIKEAREYIEHYETIRGYYEYEEDGYDEYNYEEDLKQELLEILGGENNDK